MQYNVLKMGESVDQGFLFTTDEIEAYRRLKKFLRPPIEIMEVFKALIFDAKDNVQQLIDGSTNKLVSLVALISIIIIIDSFLFFSFYFFLGRGEGRGVFNSLPNFHNYVPQTG